MSQQAPSQQQPLPRRQTQHMPSLATTQTAPLRPPYLSLPTSDPSTTAVMPAIPLQNLQNPAPSPRNALSLSSTSPSITVVAKKQWTEFWNASNGIGSAALVLAVVFGVGAWVGMNMQYNQGAKSLELSIWTTCVDHESVQNTSLCQEVMGKNFDQFQKRAAATPIQKRELRLSENELFPIIEDVLPASRMEALVSSLGDDFERALIVARDSNDPDPYLNSEIRATVFPLVHLLYTPFRWAFAQIESLILFSLYLVHKMFHWISIAFWFGFQCCLYTMLENLIKNVFAEFDAAIVELMPDWMPSIVVSGLATAVGMAGLKSYWYGFAFWECVKWMFIWRVGIFVVCQALVGIWVAYNAWYDHVKRRD